MLNVVSETAWEMTAEINALNSKYRRLANLDFFILDNSIRESTVGQLRSHTLEDKKAIYKQCKKCRMHSVVVACFSDIRGVDDEFCQWLKDSGEDFSKFFSFSEVLGDNQVDGMYDLEAIPTSLRKNHKYGLYNVIFQVDLADGNIAWRMGWSIDDLCALIEKRMYWVYDNIHPQGRIALNFRDLPIVFRRSPQRVLKVVEYLAKIPEDKRMWGIMYEDALGESLPGEMGAWTRAIRKVMDLSGWGNGHLLNHVHEKWELQTAATLECLAAGSDGVWASLCTEGAAIGHASSTITLMNLIRLGNRKVLGKYNCNAFRKAAITVTQLSTTEMPHRNQCVYGEGALDLVYGSLGVGDFSIGDFFGEVTRNRVTTIATPRMIVDHLNASFGPDPQFTLEMGKRMKERMLADLTEEPPRKEEYQSEMGLAVLFQRSGGHMTSQMIKTIANVEMNRELHRKLLADIKELWNFRESKEKLRKDGRLGYESFYHGFLAPYYACFRCKDARQVFQVVDTDNDGYIEWAEFLVYLKWAIVQYPYTNSADEVIKIAFQKALAPLAEMERAYYESNSIRGLNRVTVKHVSETWKG